MKDSKVLGLEYAIGILHGSVDSNSTKSYGCYLSLGPYLFCQYSPI